MQDDASGGHGPAALAPRAAAALKFSGNEGFHHELRRRVERFFRFTGRSQRDCPQMYLKTACVLLWLAASYVLLVFFAANWWQALLLALSVGMAAAAVAFNVQHDGGHHAYSGRRWINKLASLTLDLLGGSSYIWARKHNALHHSYANITGHDTDIELGVFGRLSPHQKRLRFHRLQHIYLWFLYGFLAVKWQFVDDFHNVITGRIGEHRLARPRGWDLVVFLGGKLAFFTLALGIPLLLHPWWAVLGVLAFISFLQGLALSVVFQLAHCVEEADFPLPDPATGRMEADWAVHQVQTTVDFARGSRLLSWFLGGLNYQVEHHLFPQVCHVHYAKLSRLVERTCHRFGVRYQAHRTFIDGLISHYRWLRRMGLPNPA